jgi:hypothetical protein
MARMVFPNHLDAKKCGNKDCKQLKCLQTKLERSILYNDIKSLNYMISKDKLPTVDIPQLIPYIYYRIRSITYIWKNPLLLYKDIKALEALNLYQNHNPVDFKQIRVIFKDHNFCNIYYLAINWVVARFYLNCNNTHEFELFEMEFEKLSMYDDDDWYGNRGMTRVYDLYKEQKKNDCMTILNKYIPSKDIVNIIISLI